MSTLVIRIAPWREGTCSVNLTYTGTDNAADRAEELIDRPLAAFESLLGRPVDSEAERVAYGKELFAALFASQAAIELFADARGKASAQDPLRVQLDLSQSLAGLHDLWWETLHDPVANAALTFTETILFSRYVSSADPRRVIVRPRAELEALVVIADPKNGEQKGLRPINVAQQLELARGALRGLREQELVSSREPVTLDDICAALRQSEEGFDVLYLVCHGFFTRKEKQSRLWLQNEDGYGEAVSGVALAARLAELPRPPRLVVLVACQSAGIGGTGPEDTGALTALGPQLASGGIPAVLAMRGNITEETMNAFLPALFAALGDADTHGQIDLAVARARKAVRDRHDAWMPLLFMRLNRGRLWVEPPAPSEDDFTESHWDDLIGHLKLKQCTPILGPGLLDHLIGPQRAVARALATLYHYPLAPHHREDLPQVAEYLSLTRRPMTARNACIRQMHTELLRRFGRDLGPNAGEQELPQLLAEAGKRARQASPAEPFAVLARLRCPLYVTTSPDSLLVDALREGGCEPVVAAFDWQGRAAKQADVALGDCPVVYHLFGQFRRRAGRPDYGSLAISQDDFFEYLVRFGADSTLPAEVREALSASSLMFLGFELSDWTFRILLQTIDALGGSGYMLGEYPHVAIQLAPDLDPAQDQESARRYLRRLACLRHADVRVYWGTVDQFLGELGARWAAGRAAAALQGAVP